MKISIKIEQKDIKIHIYISENEKWGANSKGASYLPAGWNLNQSTVILTNSCLVREDGKIYGNLIYSSGENSLCTNAMRQSSHTISKHQAEPTRQ